MALGPGGINQEGWTPQQVTDYGRYYSDPNGFQTSIWGQRGGTPTVGAATPGASGGGFSMVGGGNYDAPQNLGMGPQAMQQQPTGYAPPATVQGPANGGGNPYLPQQAGAIGQQMSDNLNRNFMPQLGMASMATGGFGGSAQGVVQANALKDMNTGLGSALGNLYGSDWNATQNRNLSRYQGDQSFYSQQRGQDQAGAALGADLMTRGQNGQWGPINNANTGYSAYTGLGSTTTSQNTGGGASGIMGGALGGYILGKNVFGGGNGSASSSSWW